MAATPSNDTVTYLDSAGQRREAIGVAILAGAGGGSSTTPPLTAGTDRSGTITAGGTAQQLAPANVARKLLKGQNLSTGDLWINEVGGTAAAQQPAYRIPAGGTFSVNTSAAVSIFGATTGQAFTATEG